MSSFISAAPVASGQVQSLDSLRGHSLPSDAMIVASATQVNPTNQNTGSYAIVESGVNSLGVTATGSVPATTLSPFADVYKEGSIYLNGTVGNYLQNTATYSNLSINWATSGMTIEAWVNYPTFVGASFLINTTNPVPTLFAFSPPTTTTGVFLGFGANTSGYVNFYYYNPSGGLQTVMGLTQLSTNTWNHIAMTCTTSGQIYLFVNGVQTQVVANRSGSLQAASFYETFQGTFTSPTNGIILGQVNSTNTNAYLADLRLTTGTPLYTGSTSSYATFTVPSAPLSSTTSPGVTQFLLRAGSNSPYVSNGALTFDRGLRQYANFGPLTFNIVTQGFTAIWRGQMNGTVASFERIFEFGAVNTATGSAISAMRGGAGQNLIFYIFPTNSSTQYYVTTTNFLTQGTNYVIAFRYTPSTQIADVWVNGVQNTSGTITTAQIVADRTVATTYLSKATDTSQNGQFSMNTLAIYNRALSNAEILTATQALNTVPATPQQKTLEIGDINGTPALSVAGNGQVSVQSIGLSSNVVPWPPAAMTGYVTSINGKTYVASASSENSGAYAWYAFDKNTTNYWNWNFSILGNLYPGGAGITYGNYTGPVTTTDTQGTVYKGEWIQLQLPTRISLSSYTVYGPSPTYDPGTFFVLGSNDGVNWTLVSSQVFVPWTTTPQTLTFQAQSSQTFSYFRMVIGAIMSSGTGNYSIPFPEWTLYGTADTSPTLTIAPATTFVTSVTTPSLTGIAASGVYAPQDFSSSGLNIPAYVVSNTATVANTVAFSSFGPFAGEGSFQFPGGAGAYVYFGSAVNGLWPGGGALTDGTIEMWVYLAKYNTNNTILLIREGNLGVSTLDWYFYITPAGVLSFVLSTSVTNYSASGGTVPLNTWSHVAFTMKAGFMTVFLNGVAGGTTTTATGTVVNTSSESLVIGNYQTNAAFTINGYISNMRLTTGQALYTTTFTPPTGPLQPIQGTTQAGLPYGTVLLLRNAPAPGRIQTTRLTGSNSVGPSGSAAVLPFPPAAMTGYSTALNAGYGQGTYVASASSEFSGYYAWSAFTKGAAPWLSGGNYAYVSPPYVYGGSARTVDVNGNSYSGDWLQIQTPSSIVLSSYTIVSATNYPVLFWILGSRDGVNWSLVDSRSGISWSATSTQTFSTNSSQAFNYFRLVIYQVNSTSSYVYIGQLVLNGQVEGLNINPDGKVGLGVVNPTRALEVAGDVVCAGTLSAGNPLMFRNRIINGDMRIAQRGTTSFTGVGGTPAYCLDRFQTYETGTGTGSRTINQVTDVPLGSGLFYSANVVYTSTVTGVSETWLRQTIEAYNCFDLVKSPVTISFWYKSNRVGSHGVRLFASQGTMTDTYQTFTVFNANTWEYKALTFSNSVGASLAGATPQNAGWILDIGPVVFAMASATVSNGDYFTLTGVQLEKGLVATPFEVRPYATELALCQRYYQKSYQPGDYAGTVGTNGIITASAVNTDSIGGTRFNVPMRATPGTTIYSTAGTAGKATVFNGGADTSAITTTYVTNVGIGYIYISAANLTQGNGYRYQYIADAEI